MNKKLNQKSAFTLAEVLITLMIIGVIAAMTMPGLKKYAALEENVSRAQKAYASVTNATKLIELQHGEMKRWGTLTSSAGEGEGEGEGKEKTLNGIDNAYKYYSEKLNVAISCEKGVSGCWEQTKELSGSKYGSANYIKSGSVGFQTADGMFWNIFGETDTAAYGVNKAQTDSLIIFIDTNGAKKPNTLGLDVFAFVVDPDRGVLPAGADNNSANCENADSSGIDCAAKVMKTGKIDYDKSEK